MTFRRFAVAAALMGAAGFAAAGDGGNPLGLPKTARRVKVKYATAEDAAKGKGAIAPLRNKADFAFSTRWDDTNNRHADKAESVAAGGFKANFYINGGVKHFVEKCYPRIKAAGGVLGNHTLTHPFVAELNPNEAMREIVGHKVTIECEASQTVASFTFPYNAPRSTFDDGYSKTLGKILQASGHYVYASAAWDVMWLGLDARTMQGSAAYFGANDNKPDAGMFAKGVERAVKTMATQQGKWHPLAVLGTHSWCDAEGDRVQSAFLKTEAGKPERWYPNDLEYAAYRYAHHFGNMRKVGHEGCEATYEYDEFPAAAFGKKADLSFVFWGAEPREVSVEGVKPEKSARGCWNMPETGMAEVKIARNGLGKVKFSIRRGAEGDRLEYRLENGGDEKLEGVTVAAIVPPRYGEMRRVVHLGDLAAGAAKEGAVELKDADATRFMTEGGAYFAASADYRCGGSDMRIWAELDEKAGPGAAGVPRDCAVAFGPVKEGELAAEALAEIAKPGTDARALAAKAGVKAIGRPERRWAGFRVGYIGKGEYAGPGMKAPPMRTYAACDVKAEREGEYTLRAAGNNASPRRWWVNGVEGAVAKAGERASDAKVRLRAGVNRVVVEWDYPGKNYCALSMGVFDGKPSNLLECLEPR